MQYRPEVDGLRAVAVLPVIAYHAGVPFLPGGFTGVDVFFVISGYLITTIVQAEVTSGGFSWARFYERRARRLLPALFTVLLASAPFAWGLLTIVEMQSFAESWVGAVLFAANIVFWSEAGYFDTDAALKPLLHLWSLGVEEQFYIIFPLLLVLIHRFMRSTLFPVMIGIVGVSFVIAMQWTSDAPSAAFFLLPARMWELGIGAIIALWLLRRKVQGHGGLAAFGLAMILVGFLVIEESHGFPGPWAALPVIGSALVLLFARPGTQVAWVLSLRPVVFIGLISYSAYLWHNPVFVYARHWAGQTPEPVVMAGLALLSLVLAAATWAYIERPFRDRAAMPLGRLLRIGLPATGVIMAMGVSGIATGGHPSRFSDAMERALAGAMDKNPERKACHGTRKNNFAPEDGCILGQADRLKGVLWGDSHAEAFAHALRLEAEGAGVGLRHLTYSSCQPIRDAYFTRGGEGWTCPDFNEDVLTLLAESPDLDWVIMGGRWTLQLLSARFDNGEGGVEPGEPMVIDVLENGVRQTSGEERADKLIARIHASVAEVLAMGKTVVLIYPVPEVAWDVPKRLARMIEEDGAAGEVSTDHGLQIARNQFATDALDQIPDDPQLIRIRPMDFLCDTDEAPGRCLASRDGRALYYDDDHLSTYGAAPIAAEIMRHLLDR